MLSASNEWPQIREGEDHDQRSLNNKNKNKMMMMGTTSSKEGEEGKVMEKPSQEQIQQQQQPLKCPRCDSTNTKFCYYNNYSLTQPRHFCKACKRYWTRGGTLRTVPVGGGCRKNKRVRRPPNPHPHSSSTTTTNSSSNTCSTNVSEPSSNTLFHLNPSGIGGGGVGGGGHLISSPFLYGLPTNLLPHHNHHSNSSPHEGIINGFPFSSYSESDHHLGGLGLGFSGILGCGDHGGIRNGKQILQDLMISNSNPSFHGSNSNTTTTTNTTTSTTTMPISSLLTSSCLQQKFNFESLFPYELDLQIKGVGSHGSEGVYMKEDGVKVEDNDHQPHGQCQIQNGYDQIHGHHHQQQPMGESQDPSMLWSNTNNNTNGNSIGVNWLDPNNYSSIGSSSVPSLI